LRTKCVALALLTTAALLACAAIRAQQASPKPVSAPPAKKRSGDVDIKGKYWHRDFAKKTILFRGDVVCTHDDTVLTTDEILVDEKAKTAVSPGKVIITDPECDITGGKGSADFNKRIAVLEGSVVMNVKPRGTDENPDDKDSVGTRLDRPTTISCAKLEYQYRKKIATGTGGVEFKQDRRTASADKAVFDQKQEILTLIGNVKGVDEDGQTFSAPDTVEICLKKGEGWMKASNATATFKIDLDEEDGEEQRSQ